MADLIPDLKEAERFLFLLDPTAECRSLLEDYPDGFTFQTFDDNKSRGQASLAAGINGPFSSVSARLGRMNKLGAGIFITVNETDLKGRKLSNITRVRAIWIEQDEGAPVPLPIEPHIVVESSPGKFHKYFLVTGVSIDDHRKLQNTLINRYNSDPSAKDVSRVLRLPGFYHNKNEPFLVRIIANNNTLPYGKDAIIDAFGLSDRSLVAPKNTKAKSSSRVLTSSTSYKNTEGDDYIEININDAKGKLPDVTLANCADFLPEIGTYSRDDWFRVLCAYHTQFDGCDEAFRVIDDWSSQCSGYQGTTDVLVQWRSLDNGYSGEKVTFRHIMGMHNQQEKLKRAAQHSSSAVTGEDLIAQCPDYNTLVCDIAPKLYRMADKNVALEKDFQTALMARYTELRPGHVLTKQDVVRAMKTKTKKPIENPTDESSPEYFNPSAPYWCRKWVWVSKDEIFINRDTGVKLSTRGFSGHYDSMLPQGDDAPTNASSFARNNNYVPKVMQISYAPGSPELFVANDISYFNTYSEKQRCVVPSEVTTEKGLKAVELLKAHISNFCGGWNREAQILCNWMATATSAPPTKIRWAMLLIGCQGDGKTLFYNLFKEALGPSNTKNIKSSTIAASAKTSFSGWVEGHCLGFVVEIKWHGHNRYEIINSIKDVITDTVVECHEKGKETRDVYNAANYFLTTNYDDAVPIEAGDRRYCVIKSKFPLDALAKSDPDYFDRLTKAIASNAGDMVAWLRTVPVHPDFDPNKPAPITDAKQSIISVSKDDKVEYVQETLEDTETPLVSKEVVCFGSLYAQLTAKYPDYFKASEQYKLNKILVDMKYTKLARIRVDGERRSLWAKNPVGSTEKEQTEWAKNFLVERIELDKKGGLGLA